MRGPEALLAEALGTMALLAVVVGSGIMGEMLAPGLPALALLANAAATAAGLYVLITLIGPISGAHFNPCVTLLMLAGRELGVLQATGYVIAQVLGAIAGVLLAHAMFDQTLLQIGTQVRTGGPQWLSECIATAGLLATIAVARRHAATQIPQLVAGYIFAAYWFTASTSFANPAVTLARAFTDTFAGIRPQDVAGFVLAQLAATSVAALLFVGKSSKL